MADFNPERFNLLSSREKEVLYWTCRGWSVERVAKRLNIGVRTINTHKYRMRNKLDLWNDITIALYAFKHKAFDMDWLESLPSGNDCTEASADPA